MNKIFGHAPAAKPQATAVAPSIQPVVSTMPPPAVEVTENASPAAPPAPAAPPVVDVTAVLDDMAAHHGEKLDWRKSIVDLMKLVGMDSSLASRKELADDLGFTGDKGDSAKMNVWLHREVIKQLAANGGNVPAELLD
jgi:hypothetical protein